MSGRPARQRLIEDHLGGVRRDIAEELITDIEAQAADRALAALLKELKVQQDRCHKAHFWDPPYGENDPITHWNYGVDSLAREMRDVIEKARHA